MKLDFFNNNHIIESSQQFFSSVLDINIAPAAKSEINVTEFLKEQLTDAQLLGKVKDARFVGMINNLTLDGKTEGQDTELALKKESDDYDMLLVFGIELIENIIPTKTDIARLTRALNRRSFSRPVVLILKYGSHISFSSAERGQYKRTGQQGEKIGRISILRDIDTHQVHAGHERILLQLRINPLKVSTFRELYAQWLEVFNVNILNKEFYNELFTWYLWAVRTVSFPNRVDDDSDDTVYNSENVIRLLTRLIFIWFVKEKGLVPEALFDKTKITETLKAFNPNAEDNSDYYKAILQNMFFATLNTEMPKDGGSRAFINDKKKNKNTGYTEEYMDHLVFRYKNLFSNPDEGLKLFENIPFLNGGLFECLDRRDPETNVEMRIDGFSTTPAKQPVVPNVLFFGRNDDLDLSDEFENNTKYKHCKVRGIINILNSYKFTIEENTPLEQEIALDPELLGKIFENLLASYNPETRTTARKQTGSYYTPREIVNYMVDESLIAYLKTKLTEKTKAFQQLGNQQTNMFGNEGKVGQLDMHIDLAAGKWDKKEDELENKLRQLFAYENEENPFTGDTETTNAIIAHLSECKILDPACGSGAFPMGILHKMVFALGKLDPCNYTWKQAQLEKAQRDKRRAQQFEDETLREVAMKSAEDKIAYVEASFGETGHELDYARKLFLIENCIYGVDIQQIAVQISKLRFFISLMVDQRVDDSRPNRNILSLPNLETKFVAANTLIPVDKPQQLMFKDPEVERTEKELHEIHQKIFFTRNYSDKKKLKQKELQTRHSLRKLYVEKAGYSKEAAEKITRWNPFDPLKAAPFFDPEVMFTIEKDKQGGYFDLVIGNPPYVRVDEIDKKLKEQYNLIYDSATGKYDIYYLFYDRARTLKKINGNLNYITPNKFCAATSAKKLRKNLLSNTTEFRIVGTTKLKVFDASNYPLIVQSKKSETFKVIFREALSIENLISSTENQYFLNENLFKHLPDNIIPINSTQIKIDLIISLLKKGNPLSNFLSISEGLRIKPSLETTNKQYLPIVKQYQFSKWSYIKEGEFIKENDFEKICSKTSERYKKTFQDKIMFAEDALEISATMDYNRMIPQGGVYFGVSINNSPLDYLLALLNSKLFSFIYEVLFAGMHMGGGYLRYRSQFLDLLPIISTTNSNLFIALTKSLLGNNETHLLPRLDLMVYKLYTLTYEECKIVDPDIVKLINQEDYEKMSIEELAEYEIK